MDVHKNTCYLRRMKTYGQRLNHALYVLLSLVCCAVLSAGCASSAQETIGVKIDDQPLFSVKTEASKVEEVQTKELRIEGKTDQKSEVAALPNIAAVPAVPAVPAGTAATGLASYYAAKFQGRRTANGETFNSKLLTAAHLTLPFGTKLRVTNLQNMKSVIVRVNDRGPHVSGRIVDLSRAAAELIGITRTGLAKVELEILKP
jgi:rare lipoprotein A